MRRHLQASTSRPQCLRSPSAQMMRPARRFTTALQPLRAHARSHRHLDPALRLAVLTQEYQRVWGSEPLPAAQTAFRRELQAKQQPFDDYEQRPEASHDEAFNLRRRLALCGFHRALIRMPKLYWVAQPGTENPATMFARLPGDRQHRQFMLVFTSLLQYQAFAAHAAMPNHSVEETDGDGLGGVIQPLKAIARMHLVLDPAPNFTAHRGLISGDEFLSFNLQQSSLQLSEHLKAGVLPERDTFLESHVFSYFATPQGAPHVSVSDVTGRVLPVFVSDVHFDAMRHSLGAAFVTKQQRYSALLNTIRATPQLQGVVLDALPPGGGWAGVASDELLRDTRYAYLAGRKL